MDKRFVSQEFAFVRDKLKDIARLIVYKDPEYLIEAAFLLGCLHSVCCQHAGNFSKEDANN
ncbi:hypothetical protein UFOVP264_4 [uncultured Caudovirales phage]|uniref:Uncharacterized protein n=1 Tax=uncultured Caudovirales phage TaxID=2100421 RepID=A0A6J5LJJ7_9CAUD|nr:hypothetical protein UFOVP264_4 [uncultured Caudovirales phage]